MNKFFIKNQPICFICNAGALGDCIATLPVIKYAVENIWTDGNYRLMVNDYFKPLFYFVPEDKFAPMKKSALTYEMFGEPYGWKILNEAIVAEDGHAAGYISSEKMSLMNYASVKFLGKILDDEYKVYPKIPLGHVDITKYNLPKKYACIIATTAHKVRVIPHDEMEKIVQYLLSIGVTPVYLGKREREVAVTQLGTSYGDTFISEGIDLVDKTSILEAAKVMSEAVCVVGPDTGLMHLAACTNVPVICGYTIINPKVMDVKNHIAVVPDENVCRFCQSETYIHNNDYNKCYIGTIECVKDLKAEKFIKEIKNYARLT